MLCQICRLEQRRPHRHSTHLVLVLELDDDGGGMLRESWRLELAKRLHRPFAQKIILVLELDDGMRRQNRRPGFPSVSNAAIRTDRVHPERVHLL